MFEKNNLISLWHISSLVKVRHKDTNRKIRTIFLIDHCAWILIPNSLQEMHSPFNSMFGSYHLRLHMCLLCCCRNHFWNHKCIWTQFFLSFFSRAYHKIKECSMREISPEPITSTSVVLLVARFYWGTRHVQCEQSS